MADVCTRFASRRMADEELARRLCGNLEAAKAKVGLKSAVSLEELVDFWEYLLEDLWHQAKAFARSRLTAGGKEM